MAILSASRRTSRIFGCGLVIYAVFNLIFLSVFFRDAVSVGRAFIFAVVRRRCSFCVWRLLCITAHRPGWMACR